MIFHMLFMWSVNLFESWVALLLILLSASLTLRAYDDADWIRNVYDWKSMTHFCVLLLWFSYLLEKQEAICYGPSIAEVEHRAMAYANSQIVWLRWLLSNLCVSQLSSTPINNDNKSAIEIANNSCLPRAHKAHRAWLSLCSTSKIAI